MNNGIALKSGIWYTVSSVLIKCIAFISTPLFTRFLTKQEYGEYNNFLSWQSVIVIFVTLNLEASLISAKFEYKENFEKYVFSILFLSTISTAVWLLLANVFMHSISPFMDLDPLYINLILIYSGVYATINIYQAYERYTYRYKNTVIVAISVSISTTLLGLILVCIMKDGFYGRVLGFVLPNIIIGIVLYVAIARAGKSIDYTVWGYALKVCLPYIPHLLSLTVLNSIDRVMINKICGPEHLALYSVAYTCGSMVTVLISSMNGAFSPWLGDQLYKKDFASIRNISKIYIASFCYLAVGIMLLAPEVLYIMGGKSYMEAVYIMPPIAMGCVCQFIYTMFVNVEQFEKKTVGMAVASMMAALINFVLNAIFIPLFGYTAAAYTTLAGFLFLLIIHMLLVKKCGYAHVYDYRFVEYATVIMMLITLGINVLYKYAYVRIFTIIIYVVLFLLLILKNRAKVMAIIKNTIKAK